MAIQLALFALIVATWFIGPRGSPLGFVPAAIGFVLAAWGMRALGRSMTPMPVPKADGELVQNGPYRFLRHPLYVGGTLFFAGLSLVFSLFGLALSGVLALFWVAKARYEERVLRERFPEYSEYQSRTWF